MGPSQDSFKFPVVLMSLQHPATLRGFSKGLADAVLAIPGVLQTTAGVFLSRLSNGGAIDVPQYQHIESMEHSFNADDTTWTARFTLFDTSTLDLLQKLLIAKRNGARSAVYFQYGYLADIRSGKPQIAMSSLYAGTIRTVSPTFVQGGVRIEIEVTAPEANVLFMERASAWWPAGTPGHVIVKQALERTPESQSALNMHVKPPRVLTPVTCAPILEAVTMGDDRAPIQFVRQVILPRLRPADPAFANVKLVLADTGPGEMTLAPIEYLRKLPDKLVRTYTIGRGQAAQVISFTLDDNEAFASQIGGTKETVAIDTRDKRIERYGGSPIIDPYAVRSPQEGPPTSITVSSASLLKMAEDERDVDYTNAANAVTTAQMEIVGDAEIYHGDYIRVTAYQGASTETAGTLPALSDIREIPEVSGVYCVMGWKHLFNVGTFTSTLFLTSQRARRRLVDATESTSGDTVAININAEES